ncbi:MAG: helix-turn-helix domain-containing protein, partial [Pseudomonadota bacterium]|nr:helix-turn-helix domain-containing protein [Pseudomonadota bacterium]
ELAVEPKQLDRQALAMLVRQFWPGNVRQLENLCRQLTVLAPGQVISVTDLPVGMAAELDADAGPSASGWQLLLEETVQHKLTLGQNAILAEVGPQFERVLLRTALAFTRGRKQEAARRLGWGRNTLTRKLKELEID